MIHGVNSGGWAIPPLIILKGKQHQASWYECGVLPRDWVIAVSDKGWTDNHIGLEWIKHFNKCTQSRTVGAYRLLILDGHSSHHSAEFQEHCTEHKIITLFMPPHSSHLLQPLDIGCFGPLKRAYGRQVEKQMRLGINHISKDDFLPAYRVAHNESIIEKNIRSSFAASGIVPYNPDQVLSNLSITVRTPSPIPSNGSEYESKTPRNPRELKRDATIIRIRRHRIQLSSSPTDRALNRIVKACEGVMCDVAILRAENKELRTANFDRFLSTLLS